MTTEFKIYRGWNSSNIGWYWGGMTVQGVLPYFYYRISDPKRVQIVDRCYYNTMADTKECSTQTLAEIKSAHFTVCQKPWTCYPDERHLCLELHELWFKLRKEAEAFYGIPVVDGVCEKKKYKQMHLEAARLPQNSLLQRDDSPDFIGPTGNSGFDY